MQPSSHERADSEAAKRLYLEQGNVSGALRDMPRHCVAECAILEVCTLPLLGTQDVAGERGLAALPLQPG